MKYCKGCFTEDVCKEEYYYQYIKENNVECPCGICLIKGICNKPCEDHKQFSEKAFNIFNNRENKNGIL